MEKVTAVVLLAFALLLAGCSDVLTEPYTYGTVEVAAEDRRGEPVPGVEYILYTGTRHLAIDSTGTDGRVVFRFVPSGPMAVSGWSLPHPYRPLDPEGGWFQTFRMEEGEQRSLTFTYVRHGASSVVDDGSDSGGLRP